MVKTWFETWNYKIHRRSYERVYFLVSHKLLKMEYYYTGNLSLLKKSNSYQMEKSYSHCDSCVVWKLWLKNLLIDRILEWRNTGPIWTEKIYPYWIGFNTPKKNTWMQFYILKSWKWNIWQSRFINKKQTCLIGVSRVLPKTKCQ